MEWWTLFLRTLFIYFFIVIMMRIMGKREIGKLSIFDLIVSFMIADISAMVIENSKEPLMKGIVPIVTLVALQIGLSLISLKSRKIRSLVDGDPSIIIKNGKIQDQTMKKSRYNLEDLMMQLREKNIPDIADVEFAILETSGKLSVFPKIERQFAMKEDLQHTSPLKPFDLPVPVIIEGKVQEDGLSKIGQNRFWLKNEIKKHGYKDFKEIFFTSVSCDGKLFIDPKDSLK